MNVTVNVNIRSNLSQQHWNSTNTVQISERNSQHTHLNEEITVKTANYLVLGDLLRTQAISSAGAPIHRLSSATSYANITGVE